ncbi:alpha/beta-hydrolase [Schizopora paradoxa]|uniref:Alpha/beta-hydrolase n=1 Tax=Schizopora paradoxa TaxID=27342 RepID=A0A0H2RS98_9AGAM|nr:alpha/beta-hydrolase [Schizopora paradoxa]
MAFVLPDLQIWPSLEAQPTDSRVREVYPEDIYPGGGYANLPMGRTKYWLFGPEDGEKVVLIHGLTIPAITWKDIAPKLVEKGFRILAYDLYGKGYTQAPQTTYSTYLFVTQLALLMQYVRWDTASIVGFSMGGAVTAGFAASFPHLVKNLVFISSAGAPRRDVSYMPYLELRELQGQLLPGYKEAISSIMSTNVLRGQMSAFQWISRYKPAGKVLIIHGTEDKIVKFDDGEYIQKIITYAELARIQGAAHDLLVDDAYSSEVLDILATFLNGA